MKAKLSFVGAEVNQGVNDQGQPKKYREIGADVLTEGNKRAYGKACDMFASFKAGDDVELTLSENGKYINAVRKFGEAAPTGGRGFGSKTSGYAPDPEKNISVYTSYVLDHMIDFKVQKLTPEAAVDMVFKVRELVKGKL